MRRSIALCLALAAATLASPAWAGPDGDDRGADAAVAACRADDAQTGCPGDTGVIDHLPDSFFVGGGGVGPQGAEVGGSDHVWVHAAGGAFAGARVSAGARTNVSVSIRAHARR